MKPKLVDTREKDRQSQILCAFALVRVLMERWRTLTELKYAMARVGFPRCERTIRRLFRALKGAGVDVLVDRKQIPHRFKVRRTRPFSRKFTP